MALKTQKQPQTAGSVDGARWSASSRLAVASTCPAASAPNDCVPTMTPSPTNVTPLRSCSTAPIIDGATAARCTSGSGVKTPSSGRAASCAAPRPAPSSSPHVSSRDAADRAQATPPPSRFSSAGMMMDATVDRANSTTPPSCQSWMVTAWAAAAVPVESRPCTVFVIQRKARLSAAERSWTAPPAVASRVSAARDGILKMEPQRTSLRRSSSAR
eukprot:scaffold4423_cov105-Isochrysis_galbana.AAC.4